MKKQMLFLLVIFTTIQLANAQTATNVQVMDTRSTNGGPIEYSHEAKFEFKARSVVGVPGSGAFSGLLTFAPWYSGDNSGNMHHQLNFNDDGIFYRNGLPQSTTWNPWQRLIIGDANGNVGNLNVTGNIGIGITNPQSVLHVTGNQAISWSDAYTNTKAGTGLVTIGDRAGNGSIFINTPTHSAAYPAGLGLDGSYDLDKRLSTINIKACGVYYPYWYSNLAFFTSNGTSLNEAMRIDASGNIGIGTVIPSFKLDVLGTIRAQEVKVNLEGKAADFVFKTDYHLRSLAEVEEYVKKNNHLPEIPSALEIEQNGLSLGEMQNKLLQKVEELTLYMIELKKENEMLKQKMEALTK